VMAEGMPVGDGIRAVNVEELLMRMCRYENYTTPTCRYDFVAVSAASERGSRWKWIGIEGLMLSAVIIGFL